jgi:membrane-bound lytic murein transglycosylase D
MVARLFLSVTALLISLPEASQAGLERQTQLRLRKLVRADASNQKKMPLNGWLRSELHRDFAHTPTLEYRMQRLVFTDGLLRPTPQEKLTPLPVLLEGLLASFKKHGSPYPMGSNNYDIPLAQHPIVDAYIDYFTGRGREFFGRWLARSDRYKPILEPILESHGLPKDTLFLAMVESGFVSHATSSAAAGGFWQFMPYTGRRFKLRQDKWVDERRDFVKSTHAAAQYLTYLHKLFGHWHLAWAAYNAGEGRVGRALKRAKVDNYWSLIDKHDILAKETEHYVPKIIAAAIVSKNRAHYGFIEVAKLSELLYEEVEVAYPVSLQRLAKHAKLPIDALKVLNPALKMAVTPPGSTYTLRLPVGQASDMKMWLHTQKDKVSLSYQSYRLRRGDSLYKVAKRFGTTVGVLSDFNQIKNAHRLQVGHRLLIPSLAKKGVKKRKSVSSRRSSVAKKKKHRRKKIIRHSVAAGETLWGISQKYGVSVSRLKEKNGLQGAHLPVGKILQIP